MALLSLHLIGGGGSLVFLIFIVALAFKVTGSFMFMGRTELEDGEISYCFATKRKANSRSGSAPERRAYHTRNTRIVFCCDRR